VRCAVEKKLVTEVVKLIDWREIEKYTVES